MIKHIFLPFLIKTESEINLLVSFGNRKFATVQSLKFLGVPIDTTLTWKHHIGELTSRLKIRLVMPLDPLSRLCP
jgi:hypothetical protein